MPSKVELKAYLAMPDDEIAAQLRHALPDKAFKSLGFLLLYADNRERAAIKKVLSLFEPVELEALGDEEIRRRCMGEGIYYAGKEAETASDNSEYLMPMFRNITQATIQKNQKGQLFRLKEERDESKSKYGNWGSLS